MRSTYAAFHNEIVAWRETMTNQQIADRLLIDHGVGAGNGECIAHYCHRNRSDFPTQRLGPKPRVVPDRARRQRDGGMTLNEIAEYWQVSRVTVWKCLRA